MMKKNFLTLLDFSPDTLRGLITRGIELKALRKAGTLHESLKNRILAMVFEKSSTRTRMSFEAGMAQLGGMAIFLSPRDTQLGRGEPIEDSARVLSRMADVIMIRTFEHEKLERFAACSEVPVINALTDLYHPCQLLADMQTWFEHRGEIQGKTVAWIGDGNNMIRIHPQHRLPRGLRPRQLHSAGRRYKRGDRTRAGGSSRQCRPGGHGRLGQHGTGRRTGLAGKGLCQLPG
jgi:ornithine carbamoyltransferase